jgi:hypothetical protein
MGATLNRKLRHVIKIISALEGLAGRAAITIG